jgi:predicted outer membrane repeat protein
MNAGTLSRAVPLLVAALLSASTALATTYVVRPDGTGDFPTIQAAINASTDGDLIELADGTFTGDGNRDVDYLGKALTVRSQSGNPEVCILDCEGAQAQPHRGFRFHLGEGPGSVLDGITITGGYAPLSDLAWYGGAVLCYGSSPTISRCRFVDNYALFAGGGVCCEGSSLSADPILTGCTFLENEADNRGGGFYCDLASPTLTDCVFSDNRAYYFGGGFHCIDSTPGVTGCLFTGNWADRGGAVACVDPSLSLTACTFTGNTANYAGGAVYSAWASPHLDSCTLYGNSAFVGGGVYCAEGGLPALERTIIAFSVSGGAFYCERPIQPPLTCCDVFGNVGGDWIGCIAGQYGINGNISEDPLFCNPDLGDFTLHVGSPCAPEHSPAGCDLIGALPVGCGATAVTVRTWGTVKALYR